MKTTLRGLAPGRRASVRSAAARAGAASSTHARRQGGIEERMKEMTDGGCLELFLRRATKQSKAALIPFKSRSTRVAARPAPRSSLPRWAKEKGARESGRLKRNVT